MRSSTKLCNGGRRQLACCALIVLMGALPIGCRSRKPSKKPIAANAAATALLEPSDQIPPEPLPVRGPEASITSPFELKRAGQEVYVTWYVVPPLSLAARRAAPDEYTAAHNRLRLGTNVRVTNPANGRSVIVRITDRGIPRRASQLDICKPAARELGILHVGLAKLRMQVLPDEQRLGAALDTHSAARHP